LSRIPDNGNVPKYGQSKVFSPAVPNSVWTVRTMPGPPKRSHPALPDRIRSILAARGLSLAEVSRSSESLAGGNRLHHIPHNFYSALRNHRFSPSIYQILALSVFSGYKLVDWLTVFGVSLDEIAHFQASLPSLRTVELDPRFYQTGISVPWFYELQEPDLSAALLPLSRWLASSSPRRFDSLPKAGRAGYRYVKIGSQDAFAFPELLPGSIVRVNHGFNALTQMPVGKKRTKSLFLIEHSSGLTCSQLCRPEPKKVVLCSGHLPYAPVELNLTTEATVLGIADVELRAIGQVEKPEVPPNLGRFWTPAPLAQPLQELHAGEFIRRARQRSGLSFREASSRTKLIARKLGDARYYCAAGSLSDYETRTLPPRHIHKLISICAVYCASAAGLLEASGASLDKAGKLSMPAEFLDLPASDVHPVSKPSHFLSEMQRRFGELPYFLHNSLSCQFGLQEISVRDVFWAGDIGRIAHPYLAGTVFLVVDRKRKVPRPALSCPKWAQPIYVLQQRDGAYLSGFCTLQNGTLILRSCFAGMPKLQRLRNRVDAEVVGQVVGIARRLP
jgi:transcriptional regulator with XRE-family HTH domain